MHLTVLLLMLWLGCLFCLQATEAEAEVAEQRIQEQVDAANAAKAQLAAAQLVRRRMRFLLAILSFMVANCRTRNP